MENLVLSCLESRLEEDRSFYGRFLMGPFKVGQGATVATALRRALLSELRGVAITGASIRGVAHEYASIEGVRESALDIVLNLKQVVLTGESSSQLPAIGHVSVQGPKAVKSKDLKLPTGIRCVDDNQHIATVSATGVLTMKLLISTGKGYLAHQSAPAESSHSSSFAPRLREGCLTPLTSTLFRRPNKEAAEVDPLLAKSLRWGRAPLDLRHKRALSVSPRRPLHVSGDIQDIVRYGYMRRLSIRISEEAIAMLPHQRELPDLMGLPPSYNRSRGLGSQAGDGGTTEVEHAMQADNGGSKRLTSAFSSSREIERNNVSKRGGGGYSLTPPHQDRWDRLAGPVLPIDAIFMPVNKVNFLVQTDDQWPETRERVIFEIWTNGSIHPRQAITEAASFLVHLFSLFRQAEPLSGSLSLGNLSAVQANGVRKGHTGWALNGDGNRRPKPT